MSGETGISKLLREMSPELNKGEYVFASVEDLHKVAREDTICEFAEKEGVTLVMERGKADALQLSYEFVASWITLRVHSSLEAVGLTAVVATKLANNGISCNVLAGYYHDHLFVPSKDSQNAMEILIQLSKATPYQ